MRLPRVSTLCAIAAPGQRRVGLAKTWHVRERRTKLGLSEVRAREGLAKSRRRGHVLTMTPASGANGLIAVDKMGTKVLFLDPVDLRDRDRARRLSAHRARTAGGAGDRPRLRADLRRRHPRPQSQTRATCSASSTCDKRAHIGDIDLRPYIAPHTLKLGPDGLIYITCENSAVVAVIDRTTHKVVEAINSGSTNGHRLIISPDGQRLYTENEEDATVSVIDLPQAQAARQDQDAAAARRHRDLGRRPHRGRGRRRGADAVPDRHRRASA